MNEGRAYDVRIVSIGAAKPMSEEELAQAGKIGVLQNRARSGQSAYNSKWGLSQNLLFVAAVLDDIEFDHPKGASLIRRLAADLSTAGWQPSEMENWRDSGWSVVCTRRQSRVQISFAGVGEHEWMLQIAPERVPGALSRLFGVNPSATSQDVYELAFAVHHALHNAQLLESPRWAWDRLPEESLSSPEPRPT